MDDHGTGPRGERGATRAERGPSRAERDPTRADRDEHRTDWAEDRTDWAHVGTLLAKERTFSAWLRTGLAVMVGGFAAARLLQDGRGSFLAVPLSAALVAVGGVILVVGYWSYRQTLNELEAEGVRSIPSWVLVAITSVLVVCALVGVFLLA